MFIAEQGSQFKKEFISQSRTQNLAKLQTAYGRHELITNAMPTHIWVEPTNFCNAKCPLCPTGNGESPRPKAMMGFYTFKTVVDEAFPYAKSMNLWNIGEPFLNPHIFKMIRYAADHNISTRISTNGFVFYNPKNIGNLLSSGLTDLVVSLDGTTGPIFNEYRKGIDFDRVFQGLRSLQETKQQLGVSSPNVVWQFLAMSQNEHQINVAKALAEQLNVVFSLKSINLDMVQANAENAVFLPNNNNLRRYHLDENHQWTLKSDRQNDCATLWRSLMVNADGTVIPCCYDYNTDLMLGHFPEQSIRQIWDGESMQKLRQKIQTERLQLGPCKKCSVDDRTIIFLDEIPVHKK